MSLLRETPGGAQETINTLIVVLLNEACNVLWTLPDQDARYVSVHVQPGISQIILLKAKLQIN